MVKPVDDKKLEAYSCYILNIAKLRTIELFLHIFCHFVYYSVDETRFYGVIPQNTTRAEVKVRPNMKRAHPEEIATPFNE